MIIIKSRIPGLTLRALFPYSAILRASLLIYAFITTNEELTSECVMKEWGDIGLLEVEEIQYHWETCRTGHRALSITSIGCVASYYRLGNTKLVGNEIS